MNNNLYFKQFKPMNTKSIFPTINHEMITNVINSSFSSFVKRCYNPEITLKNILHGYYLENTKDYNSLLSFVEEKFYNPYPVTYVDSDQLYSDYMQKFNPDFFKDSLRNSFFTKVFRDKYNKLSDVEKYLLAYLMQTGNPKGFNPLPCSLFDKDIFYQYWLTTTSTLIHNYVLSFSEDTTTESSAMKVAI